MSEPAPSEHEIFYRAIEISDAAERETYLRRVCDAELRQAVDALLADHARAGAFLDECSAALVWPKDMSPESTILSVGDAEVGSRVGPYTLVRCLGEGGSGIVFEAEQERPVRRRVALKILKLGWDTRRVIARFEDERQTLALMEHPNIARVIDAGTTGSGRPYFVMELVHGAKITRYCEERRLGVRGRLQLMLQVCSAIQHAHQKGVIHRDLKPSNILVSTVDDQPLPKVIDFGIAKATAETSANSTHPVGAQVEGTPAYMSPEQQRGSIQSDTRSDIFSLGVVLNELVAGHLPSDAGGLRGTRNECAHDGSERPGRVNGVAQSAVPRLPGDLEWIVRKAVDVYPERRYQTVRGFAQDLENYLANRPVEAHPPSRLYRMEKLVRRNKLATAAIVVAAFALTGGFTASTVLLFRARAAERQEALLRAEAEERAHVARAAILIMRGKKAEANDEIERMGGNLMQPSVEATQVFRDLAIWSALRADWKTAGQRLIALSRVNRFDDADQSDNATRDLVPIAPTLIEAGDVAAYRTFHQQLLERLGQTTNPIAAEQILKGCLLLPEKAESLDLLQPLAAVAEQSVAKLPFVPIDHLVAWRCTVLGLWSYRRGHPEEALSWCDRALEYRDDDLARVAYTRVVRGMALTALERTDAGRDDREMARKLIEATFSLPLEFRNQGFWNDWLAARILLRQSSSSL